MPELYIQIRYYEFNIDTDNLSKVKKKFNIEETLRNYIFLLPEFDFGLHYNLVMIENLSVHRGMTDKQFRVKFDINIEGIFLGKFL